MANQQDQQSPENTDGTIQRIELEADGPIDWSQALKDLESSEPKAEPAPVPPRRQAPVEEEASAAAKPAYIPRPPRKAPIIAEGTPPAEELSEVLTSVNSALNQLKRFEASNRTLIAPNIFRVWEDSLREAATVMTREYRRLREVQEPIEKPQDPAEADKAVGDEA